MLGTELLDMSNVVATLVTATENENALIDISIDGNTITPAQNTIFVTIVNGQSVTKMKIFTSIIISNSIQYSEYDNSSVFLADDGVKAISDIAPNVDLTNYYDKREVDSLLEDETNVIDLDNFVILSTTQTINADKTFNNICIFVSSIDGMSTITGSSFIKSDADNTVVLLGTDGVKPTAEFGSGSVDYSNYVKISGQEEQTINGELVQQLEQYFPFDGIRQNQYITKLDEMKGFVKLDGQNSQKIEGKLLKSYSEQSFRAMNNYQYITKMDAKKGFLRL
ncbi:MAG: hypothetical protein EZS28_048845, partial [Streblomastix strix]